jgi:murein DD-endopeptidase MepM/ murein hydrolase activator NlpD
MRYEKSILFAALVLLLSIRMTGQAAAVEIFPIGGEGGVVYLVARNNSNIPYFVEIDYLYLENMDVDPKSIFQENLQPGQKAVLASIYATGKGKPKWDFNFKQVLGVPERVKPEENYVYRLPFPKGNASLVTQGYLGAISHRNAFAIDFMMEEGTPICAARDGVVVEVKEDSDYGCPEPKCGKYGNYILIMHRDGTFSGYWHLMLNGAIVETGQQVNVGQVIGFSGNTGWSNGPHLHFEVFYLTAEGRKTIATRFATQRSPQTLIEAGKLYWH